MRHKQNEILLDSYLEFLTYSRENFILTEAEEQQLLEGITRDKLKTFSQKNMKIIEKALHGAKANINGLRQNAKRYAKTLEKDFKSGMTQEEASKRMVKDGVVVITKEIKAMKEKAIGEWTTEKKIWVAILMFVLIFYVNTILMLLLTHMLKNPQLAMHITTIIIGPMVEESVKAYFIEKGMPWVGTGVVFGIELVYYLCGMMFGGIKVISKFLLLRLGTLLMHFTTTYVQKKIIESGEAAEKDRRFIAWTVGVGIHVLWNIMSIVYEKEIAGWVLGPQLGP